MKFINICPICQMNSFKVVLNANGAAADKFNSFTVIQCQNCSVEMTNPQPEESEMAEFYDEEFVSYQDELSKHPHKIKDKMFNYLISASANQKLKFVESVFKIGADSKILDVGCGKQIFLQKIKTKYQCEVLGVDFSENVVNYSKTTLNIPCIQGGVPNIDKQNYYDLITMWHYLEHELAPVSVLQKSYSLLKPGGKLIIEIPNAASIENKVFGHQSYLRDLPRHLFHFSPLAIENILKSQGFSIEKIDFPIFSGGLIGTFQNLLFNGKVYKSLKKNIFYFAALSYLLVIFDILFSKTSRGSIIRIVAVKPIA